MTTTAKEFLAKVGSQKAIKSPDAFLAEHAAFITSQGWGDKIKGHNALSALGILHKLAAAAAVMERPTSPAGVRAPGKVRVIKPTGQVREAKREGWCVTLRNDAGEVVETRDGLPHSVRADETAARLLDVQGASGWTALVSFETPKIKSSKVIRFEEAARILYGKRVTYQATHTNKSNGEWTMRVRNDVSKFSRG